MECKENYQLKRSVLLVVFMLYLSSMFSTMQTSFPDIFVSVNSVITQNYMAHDPIDITNDNELAMMTTSGSGTVIDPYIISGWNITGSSTYGISITDTTKHFRIEHCWIANSDYSGIYVDNVASGTTTITNNTCSNNVWTGIVLASSGSAIVTGNTCNQNMDGGIYIGNSGSSTVTNNICNDNDFAGIHVQDSGFSILIDNTCNQNVDGGIFLEESSSSIVTINSCNKNSINGIYISYSASSTVTNNTCNYNAFGINVDSSTSTAVTNNTCTNNIHGISVDSSGSSTAANNICVNNGDGISFGNEYSSSITNNTCFNNDWIGISLENSGSSIVTNNTCGKNSLGIYIDTCSSSTVVNNIFVNDGMYLVTSSKGDLLSYIVENNTVNGLPLGYFENLNDITVNGTYGQLILINCLNTIVKNHDFSDTAVGIALHYCDENQVVNNTCNSNSHSGIILSSSTNSTVVNNTCTNNSESGIHLDFCISSVLAHNTCTCNTNQGIYLSYSENNSLIWNILYENGYYGIVLSDDSKNNSIHHNDFIANGYDYSHSQAYDTGINNQWYDEKTLEGNYWSDYNGDGSYLVSGSAGAIDPYPSSVPFCISSTTDSNGFFSILSRIGLFILILGLLAAVLFINRRKNA